MWDGLGQGVHLLAQLMLAVCERTLLVERAVALVGEVPAKRSLVIF